MRTISCFALWMLYVGLLPAAETRQQEEFFESKIRPVLVSKCYECHSAKSKEPKGGLLLDTREGIRRGGDNGHAVVPGQLDDSLILAALRHESFEMPPEEQLDEAVVADFEKWIREGAYDPRDGKSALIRTEIDFERAREFWSFKPISVPKPPSVKNVAWAKSDIDRFVLARLESKGVKPVADADSHSLARRIYFDLIGLPPTPQQLSDFANAMKRGPDGAIAALVDELLASRHFGERWGRHWLDVVRYAESTGMERNATFTNAWRYRDYVIESYNNDTPLDQFIYEQVAGDLLPHDSHQQRDRQLIATGMLAMGPKSLNETKKEKFKMDVVDEQIDVVSRAFLGLTASCARCHDHKFDPIPQKEYYSLAGIFTSTDTLYGTTKTNGNRNPGRLLAITGDKVAPSAVSGGAKGANEEKKYRAQLKSLQKRLVNYEKQAKIAKNDKAKKAAEKRVSDTKDSVRRIANRLKQATQPKVDTTDATMLVMAVNDANNISDTKLRIRGEPDEYGREVPRGFLTVATLEDAPSLDDEKSGRYELANWLARESNPLTARVAVNRVWQHLFGRGLVSTVNNFGANGDRPTHPMLLDHLATIFAADGLSTKQLIRRIMTSRVYRLSTNDDPGGLAADPDNQLLWRMNQRRLEAESIRDAMLLASDQLDLKPQPGSQVQRMGEGIIGRNLKADSLGDQHVARSVYLPIVRGAVPEILTLFDFPEPSIIGGARNVTTVPTQALFMMNSPQVLKSAKHLADRIIAEKDDPRERVRQAYLLTLSRSPSDAEISRALAFINETQRTVKPIEKKQKIEPETIAWAGFCQSLFASSEFRYVN